MLRIGRGRHCYLFSRLNSWLRSGRGGEIPKANPWRKARSTIYFFTKSLNSYSPTTYKHFPVSFGFHLVLSLARGINSFCLCNLRKIQNEYNTSQNQNYIFALSIQPNLFTRLTQYRTINKTTIFLYLHNIFHICKNVPTGQETLPSLRTLALAASRVNIPNTEKQDLPASIIKDLPKITNRFLSLKINNNTFNSWFVHINNIRYNEPYGVRVSSCRCQKVGTTDTEIWWYRTMNRQAVVNIH